MSQAWLGAVATSESAGGELCDYLDELEVTEPTGRREAVRAGKSVALRSLIVRHRNETGTISAYTRVMLGDGGAAVEREARLLGSLAGSCAPLALAKHVDEDSGFSAITTSALAGRPLDLDARCPQDLEDCLPVSDMATIESHPWVVASSLVLQDPVFEAALGLIGRANQWPVCVMHGDAAPWNALRSPEGSLLLFDWEFGDMEGLWLFDRAFWTVQTQRLVRRSSAEKAALGGVEGIVGRYPEVGRRAAAGVTSLMALSVSARMALGGDRAGADWWKLCAATCIQLGEKGLVR